jgi:hypothetical protein
VFYLHHRTSEDLDLFAVEDVQLSEIPFWVRTVWHTDHAVVRAAPQFMSLLIRDVKVEFVVDPLSERGDRERVNLGEHSLMVDTLTNIGTNKLCTLVSRTEPKDFVDYYFLSQDVLGLTFESLFESARKKEALLDDPLTAAYQLEEGLSFLREHRQLLPRISRPFDLEAMLSFYGNLVEKIYQKGRG